ncbi:MAG: 4Fe-4S dicluster domain-containing protein [Candidatus Electryonea clarkiae]|nr:4Fe-4S dicluster domain-containing protein [Candidatus Electryonea clarkiae]
MFSILVDVTLCTGCEQCAAACVEANNLDPVAAEIDRSSTKDGLTGNRLSTVLKVGEKSFAKKACMHCVEPSCVAACLCGGITKTPEGPVIYDPDKCIGCRYCMLACPFHIPRYEWDDLTPHIKKCDFCFERLQNGQIPACVEQCPTGALTFGERNALLHEAHQRIKNKPNLYINRVFGEEEYGGTSVIYISDVDLCELGFPERDTAPITDITEPLIHKTPLIGMTAMGSMLGLNWIIKRRMEQSGNNENEDISVGDKNMGGKK